MCVQIFRLFSQPANNCWKVTVLRVTDKSLARPGMKQAQKHVRDARDFNNIDTRAIIKFLFLQGKAPKEILALLTQALACFLPGWVKDLSAPLYEPSKIFAKRMFSFSTSVRLS